MPKKKRKNTGRTPAPARPRPAAPLLDLDEAIQPLTDDERYDLLDDGYKAIQQQGRARARRLHQGWRDAEISGDDLADALATVWFDCVTPLAHLACDAWVDMFRDAGYAVDGEPEPPPDGPLTLYRGVAFSRVAKRLARKHWRGELAGPEHGWSWTDSQQEAKQFAAAAVRDLPGPWVVFQATVPPKALLAQITVNGEYIVDTRLLPSPPTVVDSSDD